MPREYEASQIQLAVSTIKGLSIDAVEKAQSGHPGTPMGLADISFELWTRYMRYDPRDPAWVGRDRFVLSCGHASMLLYSMLHLSGYDLPLSQIESFRQWESKTPGHPEHGMTPSRLLRSVDDALYAAKDAGRDGWRFALATEDEGTDQQRRVLVVPDTDIALPEGADRPRFPDD